MTNQDPKDLTNKNIFISRSSTLMDCLKKMDAEHVKLLIILDQDKFYSIISIGDVQRAIIKNTDLNSDVE